MKKNFTNEFKIGLFIVLACCVGAIFWMKTNTAKVNTYEVKTSFKYAGGLKENSLVWLTGVEVGRITKVEFVYEPETKVNLTLTLNENAKVRKDSTAFISTAGFIGDSYLGITSGSPGSEFAAPGDTIGSEEPIEMRELMKKADSIARKLDDTLTDVKKLAGNLNANVTDTLSNFKELGANLNGLVQENRAKIGNIVTNVETMTVNFDEFSSDIKQHPWKLLMKGKE